MNTQIRLFLFTMTILLLFSLAVMINAALNFRNYGYQNAIEKSMIAAQLVRDGLTAHMVNGIMDKRSFFLKKIAKTENIKRLWIVRAQSVIDQFGPGLGNEHPEDAIDRQVLQTGKVIQDFQEDLSKAVVRVTIPYVATSYDDPNCLQCHHVKEGETLGAISLELDISNLRYEGINALLRIALITILFILIAMIAIRIITKPYLSFFSDISNALQKAHQGQFDQKIHTDIQARDIRQIADMLNLLLEKFQQTIGNVEHKLAILLKSNQSNSSDPLQKASDTINMLSQIHRFKNTIELDASLAQIYERIAAVVKEVTHCETFVIYTVNTKQNIKEPVYSTLEALPCDPLTFSEANECRAIRTNNLVISEQFPKLCAYYTGQYDYYLCIPHTITERHIIIIMLLSNEKEKAEQFRQKIPTLRSYLENAKPVIESKLLMERLKEKSLHDGLTGLYNRKFLEEFIDQMTLQAKRKSTSYGVLMIDIDFFKKINDTYGHDIGDEFIKKLSDMIRHTIRKSDIASRYGGEEFVVLLYETDLENAARVAENIRHRFESELLLVQGNHIKATVSIGVAHFPGQGHTMRETIKYADVALYQAKHNGRNRVIIFKKEMYSEKSY